MEDKESRYDDGSAESRPLNGVDNMPEEMEEEVVSTKKHKTPWQRFRSFIAHSTDWIGAILVRLFFLAASLTCIGITASSITIKNNLAYLLFIPVLLIIIEAVVTFKYKKNQEWKWATPCIYAFQLCVVPSIWVMEYVNFERRTDQMNNITVVECITDFSSGEALNFTQSFTALASTDIDTMKNVAAQFCLCNECVPFMEQGLLFLMVIGRWLLPKSADITSDQKAQLLLVNIAISADILELFELMKEDAVNENADLVLAVLLVWSCSLLQFGVVSTANASQKSRVPSCFKSEMWALVTLLCLDDLSFLILRLICIIKFDVRSYNSYFFAAKNALVLILDINRIIALHIESRKTSISEVQPRRPTHIRR